MRTFLAKKNLIVVRVSLYALFYAACGFVVTGIALVVMNKAKKDLEEGTVIDISTEPVVEG